MTHHQNTLPPPARSEKASIRTLLILLTMWFGVAFNIQISIHLLPKTIEVISSDPRIISFLLFLNPLFGIIAQPIVGILGDRVWTPIGRRAFFIIISAPITALCMWFLPEVAVLWQLFLFVVLYEFFTDIIIGSDHPLLADLVPPKQRLFVNALIVTALQVSAIVILRFGFGQAIDAFGESIMFKIGAVAQIGLIMIPAFFLRESKPQIDPTRPKLSLKRYILDIWEHIELRRLALLSFTASVFDNLILTYMVLFATNSLGASVSEYGSRWAIMPLVGLALALPSGWIIEKWIPKQKALLAALLFELAACLIAINASSVDHLTYIALFFGIGMIIKNVTLKPFTTEYIPRDIIGQVLGALNICYAVGRSLAALAGGWIVYWLGGDYRSLFYFAIGIGIAACIMCLRITDHRFNQRKAAEKG